MIEVEKKFQPTEEQLANMLEGAEFVGEVVNHDVYYDYPDYRMYKSPENLCLRMRNGTFELKMHTGKGVAKEFETIEEIQEYFQIDNLENFVRQNLTPIIDFKTKRIKYTKEGFTIDVDETDFGNGIKYKMCELELLMDDEGQVDVALERIKIFAQKYNFEIKKIFSKHREYLRVTKPEVYKEIFQKEKKTKEIKVS